jgi:hypothetical protein
METFFLIGLGIIICLVILGVAQHIGNDCGDIFFDGFYGNTSIGDKLREKEQLNKK